MELTFLGVRGSTAAVGSAFVEYGGHTSCVAVRVAGQDRPTLVLDAGTGIRELGSLLCGAPFTGMIALTHLHWDHLQGLPFSPALTHADSSVEVYLPADTGSEYEPAVDLVGRVLGPPFFPITPRQLEGHWSFRYLGERDELADSIRLRTAEVRHKGGRTLGIRVEADDASVAYLPDHDLEDPDPVAAELAQGVDVLIHDGQYAADDIAGFRRYGHSSVNRASQFADLAEVGELVLTHHAPDRDDVALAALASRHITTPQGRPVTFARQGQRIALPCT